MSPRFEPVSVTELSRVPLLAAIPGADLVKLAERIERRDAAPGSAIRRSGDGGPRLLIVLSGLAAVTEPGAARGMLKPGDVLDTVERPGASVGAITPCVVAECDDATYDELIRPHRA